MPLPTEAQGVLDAAAQRLGETLEIGHPIFKDAIVAVVVLTVDMHHSLISNCPVEELPSLLQMSADLTAHPRSPVGKLT